jgi:hypothetical protein
MHTVSGRWEVSELVEYVEGLRANVLDVTASISSSVPDLFHVPFCHCTHNTLYHSTAVKSNRIQSIVCGVKHAHLARMHGVISFLIGKLYFIRRLLAIMLTFKTPGLMMHAFAWRASQIF